jgi:hypothetical protein
MPEREAACHCGQLALHVAGDPLVVSICHCLACQRRTGSAFAMQAGFRADQVRVEGRFNDYSRTSDEADRREHIFHFCPDCGSQVFYTEPAAPELIVVAVGAFADPSFPPPTESGYEHRRHQWVGLPDTVRRDGQDLGLWRGAAMHLYEAGRYSEAAAKGRELIDARPDQVYLHYNVACCEGRAGHAAGAVTHLRQAIEAWGGFRDMASHDDDFDPIRDDPGFQELIGS